jgi:hypothetical protein
MGDLLDLQQAPVVLKARSAAVQAGSLVSVDAKIASVVNRGLGSQRPSFFVILYETGPAFFGSRGDQR